MALFKLGNVVSTPAALAFCANHAINLSALIARHTGGDFGDLDEQDVKTNVRAIQHDERILSAYKLHGEKLYLITEGDRSYTTLLLAEEY